VLLPLVGSVSAISRTDRQLAAYAGPWLPAHGRVAASTTSRVSRRQANPRLREIPARQCSSAVGSASALAQSAAGPRRISIVAPRRKLLIALSRDMSTHVEIRRVLS